VDGFQIDQPEIPLEQREAVADGARRYFELAERYTSSSVPAAVVIMSGVTASGKSYLAHALASRIGAAVISSDVTRKRLAGVDPAESQIQPVDQGIYSTGMTARTYDKMLSEAAPFLEKRRPVILDASYLRREHREQARALAERTGLRFLAVECLADESLVRERLQLRRSAVWSPSDGRWEIYQAQLQRAEPLSEMSEAELLTIDGAMPLAEQLERVEACLRS
jgi:predicted kinase